MDSHQYFQIKDHCYFWLKKALNLGIELGIDFTDH